VKSSQYALIAIVIAVIIGAGVFYLKNKTTNSEGDDTVTQLTNADNKAMGETFLAENGKMEGVITTASGLRITNRYFKRHRSLRRHYNRRQSIRQFIQTWRANYFRSKPRYRWLDRRSAINERRRQS
jgi:hypothetical protein